MNFDHTIYKQLFMESLSSQININSTTNDGENENKSGNNKKIDYIHKRMEEVLKGEKDSTPKDNTINLKD